MFVQVVQAKAKDEAGVKDMFDRWDTEVKPAAKGYLGATGGVTDDGQLLVIARFESEQAAEANNDLAEQQQWFSEFEKRVDDLSFTNYTNVDINQDGGSDDAGFVQVIRVKGGDVAAYRALDQEMDSKLREVRPDVIGGITAYTDDGDVTTVVYFTSQEEARKNESNPEFQELAKEFMSLAGEPTFYDIKNPWFASA
jgi:hypothetical protein